MAALKVFWSDDYDRLYPVPAMAVVVAADEAQARELLAQRLRDERLKPDGFTLHEVDATRANVAAFDNGDY